MGTQVKKNLMNVDHDREEAYFFHREKELIENLREKLKLELIQGGKSDSTSDESASTLALIDEEKKAA